MIIILRKFVRTEISPNLMHIFLDGTELPNTESTPISLHGITIVPATFFMLAAIVAMVLFIRKKRHGETNKKETKGTYLHIDIHIY